MGTSTSSPLSKRPSVQAKASAPFDAGPEAGKLPATKHGAQFHIALTGVEPLLDSRPPDVKELLTRLQALEDLEDVQASQASRLTDLERQVFLLQAKRISELEARIADLERSRRRRRKPPTNSTLLLLLESSVMGLMDDTGKMLRPPRRLL